MQRHGETTATVGPEDNWALPEGLIYGDTKARVSMLLADMDGDGLVDVVSSFGEGNPLLRVWLNRIKANEDCAASACWQLRGAETLPSGWGRPNFVPDDHPVTPARHGLADMDGDGRADLVEIGRGPMRVLLNKASGWIRGP